MVEKSKIMIGGTLLELKNLVDISKKTIILVGEVHTHITIHPEYDNSIRKQKDIIDLVNAKFGKDKTYFYSEAPCAFQQQVLETKIYSACVVVQYAKMEMPVKLSTICAETRDEKGMCDSEYSDDILSIFNKNADVDCIIVQIGLAHIVELKKHIIEKRPDINIIIVNTASQDQITRLHSVLTDTFDGLELLDIEKPYDLPVEVNGGYKKRSRKRSRKSGRKSRKRKSRKRKSRKRKSRKRKSRKRKGRKRKGRKNM